MFKPIQPFVFFRYFMSFSGAHTELGTESLIQSTGQGDFSKSVKHNWVQVLSY